MSSKTYDDVVIRQRDQFTELFKSTLHATFANPWVFLKKTSARLDDDADADIFLPSLPDTKERIEKEMPRRSGNERIINKWIYSIPEDPLQINEAADMVQLLVLKVYSHIRSQVCNQVELFAESFFKLPLMRRLEEDMSKIELSDVDKEGYRVVKENAQKELENTKIACVEIGECLAIIENFTLKSTEYRERSASTMMT